MTAPKRRWFAYSLRTLFVVVTMLCVVLGWLAYSIRWISQRHDALAHLHIGSYAGPGGVVCNNVMLDLSQQFLAQAARDVKPPWSIRLLGETGVGTISVYGPNHATIAENLARLFPEASVNSQDSPPPTDLERMLDMRMKVDPIYRLLFQEQTAEQQTPVPNSPNEPVE